MSSWSELDSQRGVVAATRRLAAILAADVVGYSRLMGEDEAGTARAVREHREAATPIIASHSGRLIKTMGDGVLLEFPSVVVAVECAIAMQIQMVERNASVPEAKRILYRIGVNLGDVLIDGDDILGDGVNIAARLEGIATPGGVCISGSAYDHVRGKIDAEFVDLGEKVLKNIARPVRVYAIKSDRGDVAPTANVSTGETAGPPRLSIVVLPFANLGGDPEQEYFADGVTESLTTDLSHMIGLVVIGRSTAFRYKGKAVDLKQIGRDLNVRYVLEGSLQRGGGRMRVNVQLIDAETGSHLWAERFDKPVADLFDMQDEIVAGLANQLRTELIDAEARRAERAVNPDAVDLIFQGWATFNFGWSPEILAKARAFFERALALDPTNIPASYGKATVDFQAASSYQVDDRAARLASAEKTFTKVLTLAPRHAPAHLMLGLVQMMTNRPLLSIAAFERAIALDRNLARAHASLGFAKVLIGRAEETEAHVQEALRLSPRDRNAFLWFVYVAAAKSHLGAEEEAVAWYRRSIEEDRNFSIAYFFLAANLARLGRKDEARTSIETGLLLNPGFTIRRFQAGMPSDHPAFVAGFQRTLEALREAGVPEG
jgi:TolB-like protein/class 3 adenylate cyclase